MEGGRKQEDENQEPDPDQDLRNAKSPDQTAKRSVSSDPEHAHQDGRYRFEDREHEVHDIGIVELIMVR
jgi:hypothetical protein